MNIKTYRIYYMRPNYFTTFISGARLPHRRHLDTTHVLLREVQATSLDEAWGLSQAEIWSPNGEATPLIIEKGLGHTSMAVGDVIELDGQYWAVAGFGFKRLPE